MGEPLLKIQKDTIITLTLTHSGSLTLQIGEKYMEEIATGLPHHIYPIFDLYGKCEKISLFCSDVRNGSPINEEIITSSIANDSDRNVPLEKADLEVHEKETDNSSVMLPSVECIPNVSTSINAAMTRSVADSVSENLLHNMSVKNRTAEIRNDNQSDSTSSW